MYVIGKIRTILGSLVNCVQKVENMEQAKEVSEAWKEQGIVNIEIIKA